MPQLLSDVLFSEMSVNFPLPVIVISLSVPITDEIISLLEESFNVESFATFMVRPFIPLLDINL